MTLTTMDLAYAVHDLNAMIQEGKLLEAFEKYYADDLVVHEDHVNRLRELHFLQEVQEFHAAHVKSVALGEDIAMTEWSIDMTPKHGGRRTLNRVTVQRWKDGKVIDERLYFYGE